MSEIENKFKQLGAEFNNSTSITENQSNEIGAHLSSEPTSITITKLSSAIGVK
jgi:hypothetical protein